MRNALLFIVLAACSGEGRDMAQLRAMTDCPGSIPISQAITIAEGQVPGGTVIAAIPDDDVKCAREIQVLTADALWEVKVAGDGTVLEHELSDENED